MVRALLRSQLASGSLTENDAYAIRGQIIGCDFKMQRLVDKWYAGDINGAVSDDVVYFRRGIEKAISREASYILAANYTAFQKFGETSNSQFPEIHLYYQWLNYLVDNEQENLTIFKESFE